MKITWTGSDALYATRFLGGRKFPSKKSKYLYFLGCTIFAKIADLFVQEHYIVSEHMRDVLKPLKLKKPITVLIDPPKDFKGLKRIKHKGFNILYYRGIGSNQVFNDWVYGYDIVKDVQGILSCAYFEFNTRRHFKKCLDIVGEQSDIIITEINGDADMTEIYPYIDFVIRPNRHDGAPRMIMECEQIGIPYYWSKEDPNIDDIIEFITKNINTPD